jgi:hypothetical protein
MASVQSNFKVIYINELSIEDPIMGGIRELL